LADLLQYISILILDDDEQVRDSTQMRLQQAGYPKVEVTGDPEEAVKKFRQTDILLTDQVLDSTEWDGIRITREAKKQARDDIQVILYSGCVSEIADQATEAGAIAFLEKPLNFNYLKLWIEETAKRIWLQQILDTTPDELAVLDTRDFGKIHFVNKTKRDVFEKGVPLEGDYCWQRFEKKGRGSKMCEGCPAHQAFKKNRSVRTEWLYMSQASGKKESVDLTAAPLKDKFGEIRAVVESCRDRTDKMIVEKFINKIERFSNWEKRLDIFLEGFRKLGYERARFYQSVPSDGETIYRGIKSVGMPEDFDIRNSSYSDRIDEPTQILQKYKKPILFVVDWQEPDRKCQPDDVVKYMFQVGANNVAHNNILLKKKWVDIPIMGNNKIIAKVSIDCGSNDKFISNYDFDILQFYSVSAGQAIFNAQHYAKTKLNHETERAIIDMAREITSAEQDPKLIDRAVRRVCKVMNTAVCSIFLYDANDNKPVLRRETTHVIDANKKHYSKIDYKEEYEPGEAVTGKVFESDKGLILNDLIEKAEKQRRGKVQNIINLEAYDFYSEILKEPLRNGLFTILRTKENTIGVIRTMNKRRQDHFGHADFDQDDLVAFEALSGQIAVAMENANLIKELDDLQKNRAEIIGDYSHTMKNLLQPLVSLSNLLHDGKDQNSELWQLFRNEISRMKTTINTMLRLVQAEAGEINLKLASVDVSDLINDVIKPYEILARDKKMTIHTNIINIKEKVNLDKQLIYDSIANLIDNAIKYGSEESQITVEAFIKGTNLHIAVLNYGDEIRPEDRKKIFEKFYSGKDVLANIKQIGLGLSFVNVVCQAHNGSVYVDPNFKKGARIIIKIPINKMENK
ncbi:MAG: response regulator, partial [Calditrichaeota bacterium]|nr:response regulator [Calditrichota bacterium]